MTGKIELTEEQWEAVKDATDTLENLSTALTVMTTVPDKTHVQALRSAMPKAVRELSTVILDVES